MNGSGNAFSVLRFANSGATAGSARVAIINPADGQVLGHWLSAEIPAHGAIQTTLANVIGGTTLAPSLTSTPAVVNLQISASFRGTVQHLIRDNNGALVNASACGPSVTAPRERLGFVPADSGTTQSWVRIVNGGNTASPATLVVRNAASGTQLGTWLSPSVPASGSATIALATLLGTVGVDPTVAGVMIDSDHLAQGLRLELTAASAQSGAVIDQTIVCGL
jgi:hypothetical protein